MMDGICMLKNGSKLTAYLLIPEVRKTFEALKGLCVDDSTNVDLEEQVALTCAEALRYAYKMSKEIDIDRDTFLTGLTQVMTSEDQDYRTKNYN